MTEKIDARGLACPQPVVLARKALAESSEITITVDNETARENLVRLADKLGCSVSIDEISGGIFKLLLKRTPGDDKAVEDKFEVSCAGAEPGGPAVYIFSGETMGRGEEELGSVLMRAFLHTVPDLNRLPDVMVFYNSGVKLAVDDSDVFEDLKKLHDLGVEMLICGTCVNYYNIKEKISIGTISNMYDIAGAMSEAGRIVKL